MTGYTKLFSSIITSTVWREKNETRILWITMLAMKDRHGLIEASIPGLADMARLSVEETLAGLEILRAPDPYSRTKEHDGRRIEDTEGGWFVLNANKYRDTMNADERREYLRVKQAEYRAKKKLQTPVNKRQQTSTDVSDEYTPLTHADADTVQSTTSLFCQKAKKQTSYSPASLEIYQAYPLKKAKPAAIRAINRALKITPSHVLLERTKAYASTRNGDLAFVPNPATWFNEERFNDDPSTWTSHKESPKPKSKSDLEYEQWTQKNNANTK